MQEFVRVLGVLHLQDLDLKARLFEHRDSSLGGTLAGLVAVVDQDHLFGVAGQKRRVLLRQGGAERRHGAVKTILMQGDGVHVALHQNEVRKFGLLRQIQGKEVLPLVKNQGFRGVEVLGSVVVLLHDAAAEADDVAPDVNDGEHQPVPEAVKKVAVLLGHGDQARSPEFLVGVALAAQEVHEAGPGVGGVADAEIDDGALGHAAAQGVLERRRTLRGGELAMEEPGGLLVEGPEPFLLLVAGLVLLVLGDFQTGPLGQMPHGVGVAHALDLHDEVHGAAALVTAEAVVDALIRGHGEGGGLFAVEGAQTKHIGAGALQAHILADNILDGVAGHQFIQK